MNIIIDTIEGTITETIIITTNELKKEYLNNSNIVIVKDEFFGYTTYLIKDINNNINRVTLETIVKKFIDNKCLIDYR